MADETPVLWSGQNSRCWLKRLSRCFPRKGQLLETSFQLVKYELHRGKMSFVFSGLSRFISERRVLFCGFGCLRTGRNWPDQGWIYEQLDVSKCGCINGSSERVRVLW